MLRILLFILLIVYVVRLLRRIGGRPTRNSPPATKPSIAPGEMIACARCGTFILKSEAIMADDHFYCSRECLAGA